jgi:hypothetical protein
LRFPCCCESLKQDWAFLQRYSAYHNIDPAVAKAGRYPALLMTTSTRDDRVHPYHARCFVKRLLDCGSNDKSGTGECECPCVYIRTAALLSLVH